MPPLEAPGAMASIRALYVHIPFCHSICPFCAFAVHRHRPDLRRGYLEHLALEAERAATIHAAGAAVESVYIGGGTPSTLTAEEVRALVRGLAGRFAIARDAEVALEVNPEDATRDYLARLADAGVNRVSLGLQSLDAATLRALGRAHSHAQSRAALAAAGEAGLANVNVDLMSGAPGISGEAFRRDVEEIAARRPAHVSLYGLDIEERTLFGRSAPVRAWAEEHREEQADLYLWAHERLTAAGYRHYEVSNFCLPGREGRQNLIVWRGGGYLGLGTGAHSCVAGERWHNARHIAPYQRELAAGRPPVAFRERLTPAQQANESLMLALRQDDGLDIPAWERGHRIVWDPARANVARLLAQGGQARYDGARLRLTPRGFLLADAITEQLMVA